MPRQSEFRLGELLSTLSLVTDLGEGLPPETAVRTCVLATRLAQEMGVPEHDLAATYYMSLLKHVGCTAFAHERAALASGDDMRVVAVVQGRDLTKPRDVAAAVLALGKGLPPLRAAATVAGIAIHAKSLINESAQAFCEVGARVGRRLGLGAEVEAALFAAFEAWNGKGLPRGLVADQIPVAVRCEHVAELTVYVDRLAGSEAALDAVERQRSQWLDPQIADVFLRIGPALLADLAAGDPLELAREVEPDTGLPQVTIEEVAMAFADVVDLKSPILHGHSRGVAELSSGAAAELRLPPTQVHDIQLAGLLHDLGRLAVRVGVWEKRASLSANEWDEVRLHPYHSERILLRSSVLAPAARIAGLHHERQDGSGYFRQLTGTSVPMTARILAAADAYQAMTSERPQRGALSAEAAADSLRREAAQRRLDTDAVRAVLAAAGHARPSRRSFTSGLLSQRELEVLLLIIQGLSTREVARRLFISPKTADHHIQHIYTKIGASSRAAAAMWAMEHGFV